MGGIATPREEGIGYSREQRDQQQPTKVAIGEVDEQRDKNCDGRENNDDAPPLLEKAAPGQRAFNQDAMTHNRVAQQQDNNRDRPGSQQIEYDQVIRQDAFG